MFVEWHPRDHEVSILKTNAVQPSTIGEVREQKHIVVFRGSVRGLGHVQIQPFDIRQAHVQFRILKSIPPHARANQEEILERGPGLVESRPWRYFAAVQFQSPQVRTFFGYGCEVNWTVRPVALHTEMLGTTAEALVDHLLHLLLFVCANVNDPPPQEFVRSHIPKSGGDFASNINKSDYEHVHM